MRDVSKLAPPLVTVLLALFVLPQFGCPDGGANENQHGVGNENGGVKVGFGDVAVAPTGDYVLFWADGKLTIGLPDSGASNPLPVGEPTRLAFAHEKDVVYVGSKVEGASDEVVAVDVLEAEVLWRAEIANADTGVMRLAASSNDQRLVVSSKGQLHVLDTLTGNTIRTHTVANEVIDLKILDDDRRALAVQAHTWNDDAPNTEIAVIDLKSGNQRKVSVPNCADTIAIDAANNHALMAPTTCRRDPVSVIALDADEERFVRNLPGFGPVAIAPDGERAVAFVDVRNIDGALFDDADQIPSTDGVRYHLMVINTTSLEFTLHPVGEELPRYTLTNDGQIVLVDFSEDDAAGTRIFDLDTGAMRDIEGPKINLDNFTMTSDSAHAYGIGPIWQPKEEGQDDEGQDDEEQDLSKALFHIDVVEERANWMGLDFAPLVINISADDASLYLRKDFSTVCVYSLETNRCVKELALANEQSAD